MELERRLVAARVSRIAYVLPEEDLLGEGLLNAGYTRQPAVAYFEKVEPHHRPAASLLEDLGGCFLPADLWAKVAGMEAEKDLIERRVVLPLAEPERAARHRVRPPRAIALLGPPGTGKTTFAKGIAARSAIWSRYTDGRPEVDVGALVAASELFTPADIEHAARMAAQTSFERDLEAIGGGAGAHGRLGASTDDYLAAIDRCRPTVTPAMVDEFSADITAHARC